MAERNDFIRDIIDADLAAGRHQRVATRFPPEPNGYLHIGHAKSICLNFGIAQDYQGTCNLRYDDTNPTKEDVEYVESIEADVRWLGFAPTAVLFSADYFGKMYELAERLVHEGKAYVCDLDDEQIRVYRGSLTEAGKPSPDRDRSVDENLDLLRRMRAGEFPDGARTLRAKIDMASPNMKMRDPLLYRIRHAHHHRSGDAWCIYPMYDWAHPIEDAIEGITHSICTLEFENNRELYDWVLDHTGPWNPRPRQYEMARLALDYTVMSKRKLLQLVEGNHVSGWDDPRMPTIAGMRRRGYSPDAIRAFADMIGVAKANSMVDIGKLEYCVRDDLNQNAPRVLGVLRPIEVELVDAAGTTLQAPYFPADVGKPGAREVAIGDRIYIDRDDWRDEAPADYRRLAPGRTVRLRHAFCITATEVTKRGPGGEVLGLRATVHADTLGGKNPSDGSKVWGVIHWVDAATSVTAEVRLYDRLFRTAKPEEGGANFLDSLDPKSLEIVHGARIEASLANAVVGTRYQLERVGYFIVDQDSTSDRLVLNRIITLAAAVAEKAVAEELSVEPKVDKSPKSKTRPKGKTPAEYRAETRARDATLAKDYERVAGMVGPDAADLLTGDRVTATLFVETIAHANYPEIAAKWIINELPRALDGKELAAVALPASELAQLVVAIAKGDLSAAAGKTILAEMVRGHSFSAGRTALDDVPKVDLRTAIDQVIGANRDKAAQYNAGKTGLLGFFVGQVMKTAPGANPTEVNEQVKQALGAAGT
ncbi:MAG TPA: glutamine--tRNA ligase/YqeY domain fusion protein [Kofleriaceae bacterium]|nr:glutamine--tRNA ligase/YqeY domain fusion protein [Kofleriaceae bacterium]